MFQSIAHFNNKLPQGYPAQPALKSNPYQFVAFNSFRTKAAVLENSISGVAVESIIKSSSWAETPLCSRTIFCGLGGYVRGPLILFQNPSFLNAYAHGNPFITGIHRLFKIFICKSSGGDEMTDSCYENCKNSAKFR